MFFRFKPEFGWSELIASLALIGVVISIVLQVNSSKPDLSMTDTSLYGTDFIDMSGKMQHFGFYRSTITNNGNMPVTLLGLKPHEDFGLIATTKYGSNIITGDLIDYKIFIIPDSVLVDHLIDGKLIISNFENQGLEKLSRINHVIKPGETFTLDLGVIYDFYSDSLKKYSNFFFMSQLHFSNGQKLNFGTGGDI